MTTGVARLGIQRGIGCCLEELIVNAFRNSQPVPFLLPGTFHFSFLVQTPLRDSKVAICPLIATHIVLYPMEQPSYHIYAASRNAIESRAADPPATCTKFSDFMCIQYYAACTQSPQYRQSRPNLQHGVPVGQAPIFV